MVEIAVEALDALGRGVGHEVERDGVRAERPSERMREVRAPGVLPGERAQVELEHVDRKGTGWARLRRILQPSPDRVDARCPHFLRCGGCDLLHASLEAQHAFKRRVVADALGLPLERVDPVIASPRALGYRALAKLVVGPDQILGSYAPRSHDVVDMSGCLVHAPVAEAIAAAIRAAPPPPDLRYVLIRASIAEARAIVTLIARRQDAPGLRALADQLAAREDVATVALQVNDSSGDELLGTAPIELLHEKGELHEAIAGTRQRLCPGAFAQVNPPAAAELYARAVELAAPRGLCVLDLYSGSGGISLQLARAGAASVLGVEETPAAVEAARESAAESGFGDRLRFEAGRVEDVLREEAFAAEVVILNPPRKGAAREVLAAITRRAPARIVYVSCDPTTLARDVALLAAHGYTLARAIPVDLFPQTRHVETVALLER